MLDGDCGERDVAQLTEESNLRQGSMMESQKNNLVYAGAEEGERFLLLGTELITFKLHGEHYSTFENATQGGYGGPPSHRHLRQDEAFYVIAGEFTFHVEGHAIPASARTFVNVPKGTLHTFENTGTEIGRVLITMAPPGDFESFVKELGERCSRDTPPPLPSEGPDDETLRRVIAVGERHHLEISPPAGELH
jgi:mannose-6-phosphate isomerase-like protein (cupin superfamily)